MDCLDVLHSVTQQNMMAIDEVLENLVQSMAYTALDEGERAGQSESTDPCANLHWRTEAHHAKRIKALWHFPTAYTINK